MLSKKDFIEKQVIFIIAKKGETISFVNENLRTMDKDRNIINQSSCHKIFAVFIIGEITITSRIMQKAHYFGFSLIFLNFSLKVYSYLGFANDGNFLLRKKQYDNFENNLDLIRWSLINKTNNQLQLLKNERYKSKDLVNSIKKITIFIDKIETETNDKRLLSLEGNISKLYFKNYFKNVDLFKNRTPRIKQDPINVLMDIGYTYLFNFIEGCTRLYGFDVYVGFHHKNFYQRKSLICDFIEPFRVIIDRKIKKAYNLKQIDINDFYQKNNQFILKKDKIKKYSSLLFKEIMMNKEEIFLYIRCFYKSFMKNLSI